MGKMWNPCECTNATRGKDDWITGACGENPGELKAEVERLQALYVKRGEWIQELTKICEGLQVIADKAIAWRRSFGGYREGCEKLGHVATEEAEDALLDALDVYKAAEAAGGK